MSQCSWWLLGWGWARVCSGEVLGEAVERAREPALGRVADLPGRVQRGVEDHLGPAVAEVGERHGGQRAVGVVEDEALGLDDLAVHAGRAHLATVVVGDREEAERAAGSDVHLDGRAHGGPAALAPPDREL